QVVREAAPPAVAGSQASSSRVRPYPVGETRAFAAAVERGTRTRSGSPGARYWQQWARYRLAAELDPASARLTGRGSLRYFNRSPDTLPDIWLHLHQNLFAPGAPRNEAVPPTTGMELTRVVAQGAVIQAVPPAQLARSAGGGYVVDASRLRIRLPRPLLPRDSVDLDVQWAFTVPPDGAPREGTDGEIFMIAYWYPQVAVYDDVSGWHADPYLGASEFYMGYGDYDVELTVPEGWLIGGTGTLTNPADVLSAETRARLDRARRGGDVVHVVADADRGAGRATTRGQNRKLTWRFRAANVRDFAFGASDQYLWDATIAVAGDANGDARPDTAAIHTFYRPSRRQWAWDQSAKYARHSIEYLSRFLWPYGYPQMTAVDGVVSCSGMEYPMVTCIGGPRDTLALYSVTVHEFAHMWFPMQVGSDEKRFAWQDEGLTRFNQIQAMQEYFKGYDRLSISRNNYLAITRTDLEEPLMRHGDHYRYGTPAYGVASYDKMAINLEMLRALLGEGTFMRAYREYGRRWLNTHPTPYDFWNTFEDVSGRDLDWFWRTWWFETWTLDHALAGVRVTPGGVEIDIEDRGSAFMPARLAVTRADGSVERTEVPVEVWLGGARRHTLRVRGSPPVASVEIDPERRFAYVSREGHRWEGRP
ncbi:MAG: M1 family metallopeptidase, partial [Gemmatimonadota bacterium]|nr:M1 family metallopeptidase [Gemmatimonadota bacterium]